MGEAFSDKEVAFSLRCIIPRRVEGGDCSFIKHSEWLNATVEYCESAHRENTDGREGAGARRWE